MGGDRPSLAFIDLAALRENFELAKRLAGRREVIAVVKADAYGHGVVAVARALCGAGCRRLAVVTVREAGELREAGVAASLLVLGGLHDGREAALARELDVTPVLHDRAGLSLALEAARGAAAPLSVQVEVDTGMRRMGVAIGEAASLLAAVAAEPALELAGVFTHLACADDPSPESALEQLARFRGVLAEARRRKIEPGLVHADNSAALLTGKVLAEALPEAGAVRPGLMLYGARPAPHLDAARALRPVMSLRSRVVAVRDVAAGEGVGYGASYRPDRPTRVASLPIGYADGVPRALSNRGAVWLAGARRPIVGRVSMDYVSVDVGDAPVAPGDEATVFGAAGGSAPDAGLPVEEQAEAAGTIAYELLVRVGARVSRRLCP